MANATEEWIMSLFTQIFLFVIPVCWLLSLYPPTSLIHTASWHSADLLVVSQLGGGGVGGNIFTFFGIWYGGKHKPMEYFFYSQLKQAQ